MSELREVDQKEALVLNLTVRLIDQVEALAKREGKTPAQWVEAVLQNAISAEAAPVAAEPKARGWVESGTSSFEPRERSRAALGTDGRGTDGRGTDGRGTDGRTELQRAWAGLSDIELDAAVWGWVDRLRTGRDATDLLSEDSVQEVLARFGLDLDASLEHRDVPRSALRKRARQLVRNRPEGSGIVRVGADQRGVGADQRVGGEQGASSEGVTPRGAAAPSASARQEDSVTFALSRLGSDLTSEDAHASGDSSSVSRVPTRTGGPDPRPAFTPVDTSAFSLSDVQSLENLYEAACRAWSGSGPAEEARRAGNDAIMALLRGDFAHAREAAERARDFEKAYHRGFAWSTFWQRVHNETMGRLMEARPANRRHG